MVVQVGHDQYSEIGLMVDLGQELVGEVKEADTLGHEAGSADGLLKGLDKKTMKTQEEVLEDDELKNSQVSEEGLKLLPMVEVVLEKGMTLGCDFYGKMKEMIEIIATRNKDTGFVLMVLGLGLGSFFGLVARFRLFLLPPSPSRFNFGDKTLSPSPNIILHPRPIRGGAPPGILPSLGGRGCNQVTTLPPFAPSSMGAPVSPLDSFAGFSTDLQVTVLNWVRLFNGFEDLKKLMVGPLTSSMSNGTPNAGSGVISAIESSSDTVRGVAAMAMEFPATDAVTSFSTLVRVPTKIRKRRRRGMPLTRYQIRNEYSMADPELYKAVDRDDPEALVEGVAMAGLVGVLR
ncbi:hypothetical protein EZV62_023390 [Acer yangbiense]|uniref:Protein SCAR n=1 Tax=Acer yangbiense TaxID=1000413 RepID=A0A5C7H3M9_9ROSI|nr:hypothetical protein EZV62_023390 [Acer yangbiense]